MRLVSNIFLLLVALGSAPAWAVEYSERSWTDDEGRAVQAKLVRLSGSTAILDQGGKIVRAPVNRLSDGDQEWVKKVRELNRWREWTMIDGAKRRLKFDNKEGDQISLKEGSEMVELTLDQLSDADRELLATIFDTAPDGGISSPLGSSNQMVRPGELPAGTPPSDGKTFNMPGTGEVREWTDVTGKKIEAAYRGVKDGQIVLFFKDREWQVPATRFIQEDQEWVYKQAMQTAMEASAAAMNNSPELATTEGNGFDAARNEIQGRMNPGLDSNGFNSNGFNSGGMSSPEQLRNEAMARHEEIRQRMEQERQERDRLHEEQFAEMRRQADERNAQREQERQERMAASESSPTPTFEDSQTRPVFEPQISEPTYPTSSPAQPMGGGTMTCGSCNHTWVVHNFKAGGKCPSCGVTIDVVEDAKSGEIITETSTSKARRYGGLVKLVVIGVLAVGGLLAKFNR